MNYAEKLADYYDQKGLEATASAYGHSRETVLRLVGEVRRSRRHWIPIKKSAPAAGGAVVTRCAAELHPATGIPLMAH